MKDAVGYALHEAMRYCLERTTHSFYCILQRDVLRLIFVGGVFCQCSTVLVDCGMLMKGPVLHLTKSALVRFYGLRLL